MAMRKTVKVQGGEREGYVPEMKSMGIDSQAIGKKRKKATWLERNKMITWFELFPSNDRLLGKPPHSPISGTCSRDTL